MTFAKGKPKKSWCPSRHSECGICPKCKDKNVLFNGVEIVLFLGQEENGLGPGQLVLISLNIKTVNRGMCLCVSQLLRINHLRWLAHQL